MRCVLVHLMEGWALIFGMAKEVGILHLTKTKCSMTLPFIPLTLKVAGVNLELA